MSNSLSNINRLIIDIREKFIFDDVVFDFSKYDFDYNPKISQVYITLFQEGLYPLRWGSKQKTLEETLNKIIFKLKTNPKFYKFDVNDSNKCRILFEIINILLFTKYIKSLLIFVLL